MMSETRQQWDRYWKGIPGAEFDFLTEEIFFRMRRAVSFAGKSILELGCGSGRLSYLALKAGAGSVTLVDSSREALDIARQLFRGAENVTVIESDFRELEPARGYDVVFSSGVVEHFRDGEILEVVKLHRRHSRQTVLTVVPAGPHYNNLRMKKPEAIRDYGWQRPLTGRQMRSLFTRAGIRVETNRKFYPFYAVPRLHGSRVLNRMLWPLGRLAGGLLLTAGTVAAIPRQ